VRERDEELARASNKDVFLAEISTLYGHQGPSDEAQVLTRHVRGCACAIMPLASATSPSVPAPHA
jgi:hypothetical protein